MIKLAIISPGFLPVPAVNGGAVEQLITNILDENEKNHTFDIDVYTINDPKLSKLNYKYTNIIVIKDLNKKYIAHLFHGVKNWVYKFIYHHKKDTFLGQQFAKLYKQNFYDAVLVENNMDIFISLLPKLNKEKKYFHLHNDFNNGDPAKTVYKTKIVIKNADTVITVSSFLEKKLKRLGATRVKILPNCIEKRKFKNLTLGEKLKERKKLLLGKKDFVCTYIGRIDRDKGIEEYLNAMLLLKNNLRIKGLVVGNLNNKYAYNLRDSTKNKNIIFTDYVANDSIYKILAISDCIVIPTQVEEAFGLVALEAMYMKIPIIASNSGALPDLLSNSGAPVIKRDANFIKDLAKEIFRMSNELQKRKWIGNREYDNSQKYSLTQSEYFEKFIDLFY
ncbi:glycosyltransferase family 1 protein [Lactobacillus helveticus]|uniref:glycosyltransferase family 4 protein n=1 Tax=Lactobacillus helveticus TaxID=1587 RepID=UPI000D7C5F48|nr:glycosyltransferase family 4 protein [Lactobacillus helveticus]PXZ09857.1 glycosyltransferase family 1 protein [Lactobacillus helveticus]PXZ11346.1 glycosyltransferase family 1 protein [Lactobacillus helveticus]